MLQSLSLLNSGNGKRIPAVDVSGTTYMSFRVADPHHLIADSDKAFHFHSDPDPTFRFNADTDPDPAHKHDANLRPLAWRPWHKDPSRLYSILRLHAFIVSVHGLPLLQFLSLESS